MALERKGGIAAGQKGHLRACLVHAGFLSSATLRSELPSLRFLLFSLLLITVTWSLSTFVWGSWEISNMFYPQAFLLACGLEG